MEVAPIGIATSMTGAARENVSSGGEERAEYIPARAEENPRLLTTPVFFTFCSST